MTYRYYNIYIFKWESNGKMVYETLFPKIYVCLKYSIKLIFPESKDQFLHTIFTIKTNFDDRKLNRSNLMVFWSKI